MRLGFAFARLLSWWHYHHPLMRSGRVAGCGWEKVRECFLYHGFFEGSMARGKGYGVARVLAISRSVSTICHRSMQDRSVEELETASSAVCKSASRWRSDGGMDNCKENELSNEEGAAGISSLETLAFCKARDPAMESTSSGEPEIRHEARTPDFYSRTRWQSDGSIDGLKENELSNEEGAARVSSHKTLADRKAQDAALESTSSGEPEIRYESRTPELHSRNRSQSDGGMKIEFSNGDDTARIFSHETLIDCKIHDPAMERTSTDAPEIRHEFITPDFYSRTRWRSDGGMDSLSENELANEEGSAYIPCYENLADSEAHDRAMERTSSGVPEISDEFESRTRWRIGRVRSQRKSYLSEEISSARVWNENTRAKWEGDLDSKIMEYAESEKVEEILWILRQHGEKSNWKPLLKTYQVLVNLLVKNSHHDLAVQLCQRMTPPDQKIDINYYKILILALCKAKDLDLAKHIMSEMSECGCKPDFHIYTSIVTCNCKQNRDEDAQNFFLEMAEAGFDPTLSTYNLLIDCLGKAGKIDAACALFQDMISKEVSADVVTYNTVMDVLCKAGRVGEAWEQLQSMKKIGVKPDRNSYSLLIINFGKIRKIAEACELFVEMAESTNTSPDVVSCSILFNYLGKAGDVDGACQLFNKLAEKGLQLDASCFVNMLRTFVKQANPKSALHFFEKLKHIDAYPDIVVYNCLIANFAKLDNIDVVMKLFQELKESHITPDSFTFNALIDVLSRNGKLDKAMKLLQEMKALGNKPSGSAYNKLIVGFGKIGDLTTAFDLLDDMTIEGVMPDTYTYTTLIHHLGRLDKVNTAYKLFEGLERQGCRPSLVTYNAIIGVLCKAGRALEANELFDEMKSRGHRPDHITYNHLLRGNKVLENTRMVLRLVREMEEAGIIKTQYQKQRHSIPLKR